MNFLVIQWLRLHTPNAGGPGINPGQETRFRMPQLRVQILQLKDCTSCMPHLRQAELNKYFVNILIKKRIRLAMQGTQVGSQVQELRFHIPWSNSACPNY